MKAAASQPLPSLNRGDVERARMVRSCRLLRAVSRHVSFITTRPLMLDIGIERENMSCHHRRLQRLSRAKCVEIMGDTHRSKAARQ